VGDRTAGDEGFDVWLEDRGVAATLVAAMESAGATPLSPEAIDVMRIEAGRPVYGVDIDESVLPEESGQGARSVSYTKGCYSGQEVVAKQKYLGRPRKLLCGVLPERRVTAPAPLHDAAGQEVGRITSCADSPTLGKTIGLATIRAPVPEAGAVLFAGGPAGQVRVVTASLPFIGPSA
jgi:folate-binding protein YgfZ